MIFVTFVLQSIYESHNIPGTLDDHTFFTSLHEDAKIIIKIIKPQGYMHKLIIQGVYSFNSASNMLQGKRAMLSLTTGGDPSSFSNHGIMGDIDLTLWPIQVCCYHFIYTEDIVAGKIFFILAHAV